jgi:SAM-dependent methyltransferase
MSYVPKEYWLERGKVYKEQFHYNKKFQLQEKMLIDYLKKISYFSTVLEVGCGFGRITKLLLSNFPEIKEYVAIDLSPDQIANAKKYVREITNKTEIKFIVSDIQSLKIDNKYDLVIAPEVLLHILPSEIKEVISKLVNWSDKHIVNIDWYEESTPKKVAPHNFMHEYERIYWDLPTVSQVVRIPIVRKGLLSKLDTKQSIFHAMVKDKAWLF